MNATCRSLNSSRIEAPGAKFAVYFAIEVSSGNLIVNEATFDLFMTFTGQEIARGQPISGFDPPGEKVRVWAVIDTLLPPGGGPALGRGCYTVKFYAPNTATGDDVDRRSVGAVNFILNE